MRNLRKHPGLYFIEELLNTFSDSEVYLVGGSVRDMLISRTDTKDYDFVVRNVEADDLEQFLLKFGKVNLVGKNFGVFKYTPYMRRKEDKDSQVKNIDIALPRKERSISKSGSRQDFIIATDPYLGIRDDLARRDFTINAMAIEFRSERLHDYFNGVEDIKKRTIRTVGGPDSRFQEDYSRVLRAIRFAVQLDFNIHTETMKSLKKFVPYLNDTIKNSQGKIERIISYEVVSSELLKAFYHRPIRAFDLFDETGVFSEIIPELEKMKGCPQPENFHSEGDVWQHTRRCLSLLDTNVLQKEFGKSTRAGIDLILGLLFHDIGKPYTIQTPEEDGVDRIRFNKHDIIGAEYAREICKRLKFFSVEGFSIDPDNLYWLVKNHLILMHGDVETMKRSTIEKYFFSRRYPSDVLLQLLYIDALATIPLVGRSDLANYRTLKKRIEEMKKLGHKKEELPIPLINGHDVIEVFNIDPGPKVGKLLALVREEQLAGRVKTKQEALEFLREQMR